jgi:hypothetical protein
VILYDHFTTLLSFIQARIWTSLTGFGFIKTLCQKRIFQSKPIALITAKYIASQFVKIKYSNVHKNENAALIKIKTAEIAKLAEKLCST